MITKNKVKSLIILIISFMWLSAIVTITRSQNIWHAFELFAVIAGLLFYVPGAIIAATIITIFSFMIFPIDLDMAIDIADLFLLGGLAGWFASRERRIQKNLATLLMKDRLTGLHNFAYFNDRLQEEKKRADRFGANLSLIMIDIDFFKPFNDIYGHRMGNEFLKRLSEIILNEVRAIDIVCRYGGEEFAVILPETSGKANEIADRLRKTVAKEDFIVGEGETVKKTISLGIAVYPRDASDEIELLDRADEALYEAKNRGRNLVINFVDLTSLEPVTVEK